MYHEVALFAKCRDKKHLVNISKIEYSNGIAMQMSIVVITKLALEESRNTDEEFLGVLQRNSIICTSKF